MKEETRELIRDVIIAIVAWVVATIVSMSIMEVSLGLGIFTGFICAGIPFGWQWLSNVFTAYSLPSIAIKAFLSILLGWIALPVVIIKDIIQMLNAE